MNPRERQHFVFGFLLKVILPSFLSVLLFILSFFVIFIPAFERKILLDKEEMIKDLTDTAWSVLQEAYLKEKSGNWTGEQAKKEAIERIKDLRYGNQLKDYFWITDMSPKMIVHPYRPELNNKDLSNFTGHNDKRIFVEFADIVKQQGEGYIKYQWQWKDDPDKIAPKLSYVKGFKPWGWIIGTGIYLNDVRDEIAAMERRLTLTSIIIIIVTVVLLSIVALHNYKTEKKKSIAESELLASREKYKMLAGASTEGLVMLVDQQYSYANNAVLDMLQYSWDAFVEQDLFCLHHKNDSADDTLYDFFQKLLKNEDVPKYLDTSLLRQDGQKINVMLSSSSVSFGGEEALLIIVKDISSQREAQRRQVEEERENLIIELQTSLLFMNQPVKRFMKDIVSCNMNSSIESVAKMMARNKSSAILVTTDDNQFLGIVTDSDITERVIARGYDLNKPVYGIMSSPINSISEDALIFEAALVMQEKNIRHLGVKDSTNRIVSVLNIRDILQIQKYSSASLIKEIESANSLDEVIEAHKRMPFIVKALIDSGAKPRNVTRLIASVSNLVLDKVIHFVLEQQGEPPAKFAFVTLGSEGRQEETLITDQDNGLIFEDVPEDRLDEVKAYFLSFSEQVCNWLDKAGYTFCHGDVMARNEKWCQPLLQWKSYFASWISNATPKALLEFNIFFDFRFSYGTFSLVEELDSYIHELLKDNKVFFLQLAQNCLLYKPPVNMFGNISLKGNGEYSNTFDIKEAIKPIINFARIYALEQNLDETNTVGRLTKLLETGVLNQNSFNDIIEAYDYLMKLRFEHQANAINENRKADNHINPKSLTHIEQEMLKKVFSQISVFQTKLSFHFKGTAS